jgi:peptidoglycan/xylan/chitin deacetylase (PgdA/CDA1 family)
MRQEQFESRLQLLKKGGFQVLPLAQALRLLSVGELPPRSVTVTFDDGMYDFYSRAFPVLKAYGFPATVYLTTYYCEFNRPVFDVVCPYILWKARPRAWNSRALLRRGATFELSSEAGRRAATDTLIGFARTERLSTRDKDELAGRLAEELGVDYGRLKAKRILHLLNSQEVAELAAKGVDFELHTHRHRTNGNAQLVHDEIQDNRERIARMTGMHASHFCYPSGSYRQSLVRWLEAEGIVSATTCDPGLASRRTSPMLLPRFVDTSAVSPVVFEGWVTGVASWLPRKRSYAGA